ncbi:Uncharacterised protein [Bacteroides intestinalis]|uniref:Tetratricopeptide repeat protein n=2 Tax=Bacteroides intestinalis TaxID=329854 RepID=A0A6N2WW27_9BACE
MIMILVILIKPILFRENIACFHFFLYLAIVKDVYLKKSANTMLKSESLIHLINNLTKQEKKEFSLYISNKPEKDYIFLFRLIDDKKISDPEELKMAFLAAKPASSFNTVVIYLFDLLIDILTRLRTEQDSYYLLFNELLHARVLYEKSMYQECFQVLKKVKEKAVYYENHFALLVAQRLELNYLLTLDFEDMDEQKLLNKQYKMNNTLKSIRQLNEQSSLYELLKYRMINRGASRSLEETQKLDDLVTSEISIVASAGVENFEIKKNHQLFQANYFITVGDYKAAFNSFVELNKLFEENSHLWNNPPVYYLMTVEGMLESLRIMHNYEGMNYFIEKLAKLSSPSSSFQLNVTYVIFIYRLFSFIDAGDFDKAGIWIAEHQTSLIDKMLLLKEQQQAEMSLYIALIHLGNGEYRKARKRLSATIGRGHLYSLPLFRTIRIVNVMIHYELGDVDYIQSEIRSIKREMSKNKGYNLKVESFLLKFLNYSFADTNRKKRAEIWESMAEEVHALYADKYETQILRKFDFVAWVEAKIFEVPLSDILKREHASKSKWQHR